MLADPGRPRRLRRRAVLSIDRRQWGLNTRDVLERLFATGLWLPPTTFQVVKPDARASTKQRARPLERNIRR
ncbi:hypothetical protein FRACA_340022 [Frankia canadensis]|uniref:Uncharacterized protein n=1 Tax=Frankia canadensis TaxID=1836972 RepID=A0A2I2KV29_9ACTN|nr:hypothetical protein FRACA_340022 [Frankia canadensis]SOU56802.1 hypothetical protein FRACA_340022 [Frankia canadensis]